MKSLTLLFALIFCSTPLLAGPGDGPIVPWPTQVEPVRIFSEDISGAWYGFDDNAEWIISIQPVSIRTDFFDVQVHSNSLYSKAAQGLFFLTPGGIWGALQIDDNHAVGIVIYRDKQGFRMRVSKDRLGILEVDLYKMRSEPTP